MASPGAAESMAPPGLRALLQRGGAGFLRTLVEVKDGLPQDVPRQITDGHYVKVTPSVPCTNGARVVVASRRLQEHLGITTSLDAAEKADYVKLLTGAELVPGCEPWATAYGCHHAGMYMGQMGDGRAMSLTRVPTPNDALHPQHEIQLKGCGRTPFNRTFDGRCVLRSCVREFLMSEFMHAAGVRTTRALAVVATGEGDVHRPWFKDGARHQSMVHEVGAVTCRVAPNFLRFGHVCYFHEIGRLDLCRQVLAAAYGELFPKEGAPKQLAPEQYPKLFREVAERSADLMANWMRVGYVHGNMNSDNMSLLGLSLDYGPFGMMADYDMFHCPWQSARQYAFRYQPDIMRINLTVLCKAVIAALEDAHGDAAAGPEAVVESVLQEYPGTYGNKWMDTVRRKLGLTDTEAGVAAAAEMHNDLASLMEVDDVDYTTLYRCLADVAEERKGFEVVAPAFRDPHGPQQEKWEAWLAKYAALPRNVSVMKQANPCIVLHNYMATIAYEAAVQGDDSIVQELHAVLDNPYADEHRTSRWFGPVPEEYVSRPGVAVMS
eukprot:TRINITY_DN7252_c0_g3_i1.p1 TRINITY_DN7252_c0_g3~~TRINITY_DN7252_c0_g3_i1.p1  ORF type:complete len:549 (+),score=172.55 TRINITY_DN7252_c0_g3_i1:40-1686(+)